MKLKKIILGLTLIFLIGCNVKSSAKNEVNVYVAASLENAMNEIVNDFEKNNDVNVLINSGSSENLMLQIEEGAKCDIFFPASEVQMKNLINKGLIDEKNVVNLLSNRIVLIKAKGSNSNVTSFENAFLAKNIAIGGEGVPIGNYARQVFTLIGNFNNIMDMEINEGANTTAVLTSVAEGANEIGVVYKTDALSMADKVEIIDEADFFDDKIIYPLGVLENSNNENVKKLYEYILSEESKSVFERYGFKIK